VFLADLSLTETINNRDYGKLWGTYHIRYIITQDTLQSHPKQPYISIQEEYDKNGIRIYRIGCVCEGK
jgi:hypothetical protein